MNRYPAKHIADQLATHGRLGDTRLIHVNEAELQGIAALMPGGKLTTNPVTGQPEAFLPFLLPLLASWGGSAAAGAGLLGGTLAGAGALSAGVGSAIGGGIGSALATTALTGDIKRGLASGITGAGIGSALGAAGGAGTALTDETTQTLAGGMPGQIGTAITPVALNPALQNLGAIGLNGGIGVAGIASEATNPSMATALGSLGPVSTPPSFTAALRAPFQSGKLGNELLKSQNLIPTVVGMGQMSELRDRDAFEAFAQQRAGEQEAKRKQAFDDRQRAYLAAQPNVARGLSPRRSQMSRRTPLPMYGASGGMTSIRRMPNWW